METQTLTTRTAPLTTTPAFPIDNVFFTAKPIQRCTEKVVVHAISCDRAQSAGVAPQIVKSFLKGKNFYRANPPRSAIGTLFVQKSSDDKIIIGLQTKLIKSDKPSCVQAFNSLKNLSAYCQANNITEVACPFLWGGLDNKFISPKMVISLLNSFPQITFNIYTGYNHSYSPVPIKSSIIFVSALQVFQSVDPFDDSYYSKMIFEAYTTPPISKDDVEPVKILKKISVVSKAPQAISTLIPIKIQPAPAFKPIPAPRKNKFIQVKSKSSSKSAPIKASPTPVANAFSVLSHEELDETLFFDYETSPVSPPKPKLHKSFFAAGGFIGPQLPYSEPSPAISPEERRRLHELVFNFLLDRASRKPCKNLYRVNDFLLEVDERDTLEYLCSLPAIYRYAHVRRLFLYYSGTKSRSFAGALRRLMFLTWDIICQTPSEIPEPDSYIHDDLRFTPSEPSFEKLNIPDDFDYPIQYEASVSDFFSMFKNLVIQLNTKAPFEFIYSTIQHFCNIPNYIYQSCTSVTSSLHKFDELASSVQEKINSFSINFDFSAFFTPLVASIRKSFSDGLIDNSIMSHIFFMFTNAISHPVGVLSAIYLMFKSNSIQEFVAALLIIISFMGVEALLAQKIIDRMLNVSYDEAEGDVYHEPQFQSANFDPFKDFLISAKSWVSADVWDQLKDYLIPFMAGAACFGIGGDYLTNFLGKAHNISSEMQRCSKDITVFEDSLADAGIFVSSRTKFISDLKSSLESLVRDIQFIEFQVNDKCSMFCNDSEYARILQFDSSLWTIRKNISTHKYDKFITTTMNSEIAQITRKFDKLKVKIDNVRSKDGTRPTPVGLIFQSPSGVGKSYMSSVFQTKLFAYLYALYQSDPKKFSMFASAKYYTTWNVQSRDKYDTGYEGQDWHFNDDAFKESSDEDHSAYITWISNQKIGQVMSDNDEKGKDYKAIGVHLCLNVYPKNSMTLRNKEALDNRFPFFYQVAAVADRQPDASHLRYYRTSPTEIFVDNVSVPTNAEMRCNDFRGIPERESTMDEVVSDVATAIYNNYVIWENRKNAVNFEDELEKSSSKIQLAKPASKVPPIATAPRWPEQTDRVSVADRVIEFKYYKLSHEIVPFVEKTNIIKVPGDGLCGYHSLAYFLQRNVQQIIEELQTSYCIHKFNKDVQDRIWNVLSSAPGSDSFWMTDDVLALASLHFGFSAMIHTGQANAHSLSNNFFPRTFHFLCQNAHWSPVVIDIKKESMFDFAFRYEKDLLFTKDLSGYCAVQDVHDLINLFPEIRKLNVDLEHPLLRNLEGAPPRFIDFIASFPDFFTVELFYRSLAKGGCLSPVKNNDSKLLTSKIQSTNVFVYSTNTGIVTAYFTKGEFVSVPFQYVAHVIRSASQVKVTFTRLKGFTGTTPASSSYTFPGASPSYTNKYDPRSYKNTPHDFSYTYDQEDVNFHYNFEDPATFFKMFGYQSNLPTETLKEKLVWAYDTVTGSIKQNFAFWYRHNDGEDSSNLFSQTLTILKTIPATLYTTFVYLFSTILRLDKSCIWLLIAVLGAGVLVNTMGLFIITHLISLLLRSVYNFWYYSFTSKEFLKYESNCKFDQSIFTAPLFQDPHICNRLNQQISRFTLKYLQDVKGSDCYDAEYKYLYELSTSLLSSNIAGHLKSLFPSDNKKNQLMYFTHLMGYYIVMNRSDQASLITLTLKMRYPNPFRPCVYFSGDDSIYLERVRQPTKYNHMPKISPVKVNVSSYSVVAENDIAKTEEVPVVTELLDFISQPNSAEDFKSIRKRVSKLTTMGSVPTSNRTPLKMLPVSTRYRDLVDQSSFEEFGYIPHFIDSSVTPLVETNIDVPIQKEGDIIDIESFDMLKDRSSIDLLNSFRKSNIASICTNPTSVCQNASPNGTPFGHTFYGWLHKYGMFSPAHGLALNDEAVVCPISPFSSNRSTYYIYRVVLVDHASDLALWRGVEKGGHLPNTEKSIPYKILCGASNPNQASSIYKFLPLQEEVGDANQYFSGIIFSVSNAFAIPVALSYHGSVTQSTGENLGAEDYIVNQLQNYAVTTAGDCGAPLVVLNPSCPRKLIGMHHLSQGNSITYSIITYRERLESMENFLPDTLSLSDFYRVKKQTQSGDVELSEFQKQLLWKPKLALETKFNKISNFVDFENAKLTYLGTGNIIGVGDFKDERGKCLSLDPVRFKTNTPWGVVEGPERTKQRTPFYGAFDVDRHPSVLSEIDPRVKAWSYAPLVDGKPNILVGQTNLYQNIPDKDIDLELLEEMTKQMTTYFATVMQGREIGISSVYEALKGNKTISPNYEPMNLRSANGVPFNFMSKPSGHHLFEFVEDRVNLLCKESHLCLDMAEEKVELANKGVRTFSIWKNCLKDELRPLAKVEDPKTRLFVAAPRDTTIAFRILFGRFKAVWTDMRDLLMHSVGINVHSVEWGMLYSRLNSMEHHFDIDFSAFDKRQLRPFIIAVGKIIIDTIDQVSKDEWKQARWTIWMEIIDTFCISYDTVFMKCNANPSGNPMTTVLNCILHLAYLFYCWCKTTNVIDFSEFSKHVSMGIFGDDGCYGVSKKYFPKFNFHTIKDIMASIGQIVTPGCKADDDGSVFDVPTTQLTFLKRRFQPFFEGQIVLAPLQTDSIEGMFVYSSVPFYDCLTWKNTITECMIEAAQHGPRYFNSFRDALRTKFATFSTLDRMHFASLIPCLSFTYRSVMSLVFERYTGCSRSVVNFNSVPIEFEGEDLLVTVDLSYIHGFLPRPGTLFFIKKNHLSMKDRTTMPSAILCRVEDWMSKGCPGNLLEIDSFFVTPAIGEDDCIDDDVFEDAFQRVNCPNIFLDGLNLRFNCWGSHLWFYDFLISSKKRVTIVSPFESFVHATRHDIARYTRMFAAGVEDEVFVRDMPSRKYVKPRSWEMDPWILGNRKIELAIIKPKMKELLDQFYTLDNEGRGACGIDSLRYHFIRLELCKSMSLPRFRKWLAMRLMLNHKTETWIPLVVKKVLHTDYNFVDLNELNNQSITLTEMAGIMELFSISYNIFTQHPEGTVVIGPQHKDPSVFCLCFNNHVMAAVPRIDEYVEGEFQPYVPFQKVEDKTVESINLLSPTLLASASVVSIVGLAALFYIKFSRTS